MEHSGGKVSIHRKVCGKLNSFHYHLAMPAFRVISKVLIQAWDSDRKYFQSIESPQLENDRFPASIHVRQGIEEGPVPSKIHSASRPGHVLCKIQVVMLFHSLSTSTPIDSSEPRSRLQNVQESWHRRLFWRKCCQQSRRGL